MLYRIYYFCSAGGGEVERANGYDPKLLESSQLALLYIQASQRSCLALQSAARRIRRNVRKSDAVLLLGVDCVVILPNTEPEGVQAVARRIYALLANIEFELQFVYDNAAFALIARLQSAHAWLVEEYIEEEVQHTVIEERRTTSDASGLPYLAFLTSYPSPRLLHLFPYELACRYHCVPVGAERGILTLATCQQFKQELISEFHKITQRDIYQVRCEASMIDDVLKYWQRTLLLKD